jgi:hypothetical protein
MVMARAMPDVIPARIESEDAEQLALELAVEEARTDPRASVSHDFVRRQLLQDASVARARIANLALKGRGEG